MPPPTSLRRTLAAIFLISLVVRTIAALPQQHPLTMDEAYSYVNAATLARGQGFVEYFIWNYLNPPEGVPHPGNLYWMPLTSLIAWIGMQLGGISFRSAQLGFIFLSALLPPLGYIIAWQISGIKRHAWVVALLMLWSGFYFRVWTTIDNFTPFAIAGTLALYATWQALSTPRLWWMLPAGIMAGFAHLARADGPLLLITISGAALGYTILSSTTESRVSPIPHLNKSTLLKCLALLILGYLIVMMPWFIRNIKLIGTPLAPGGSRTIWLRSYNDLFSYNRDLSWQSYLAWGWGPILQSKWWALQQNLQRVLGEMGLIFALPLASIGWWKERHHPLFQIVMLYFLLLFAAMTLVFTFPGPRGALFHSGGVILPYLFSAAVIGLDATVAFISRHRRNWRVKPAQTVFSAGLVGLAIFLTLIIYLRDLPQLGQPAEQVYAEIAATLKGQEATVMVINPPAYLYFGGYQAIAIPNEPITTTLEVAGYYGATYLALDEQAPSPLKPYYSDQVSHSRLKLEATLAGPTYLYHILP